VSRLSLLPLGVERYGASTPACAGPETIGVNRCPQAGDPLFAVTCDHAPPLTGGVLILGAGQDVIGFPVAGIRLYVDVLQPLFFFTAVTSAGGTSSVALPLSGVPRGARVFCQFAWLNTAACGGFGTLSASDALDLRVQ
jgi:hypothetical protein